MKKYILQVKGTHCGSCKILLEDVIGEQDFISKVKVDLKKEFVEIETESTESVENIVNFLNEKIKKNGYKLFADEFDKLTTGKIIIEKDYSLMQAIPIGLVFLLLFFILQKSGLLNFGIGGKVTVSTSFIIGLIASLSSCLAVVGGLVLSLSAKVAEDNEKNNQNTGTKKLFILFHAGRLLGFAFLGGVLGMIGRELGVSFMFSTILGIIASLVMIMLGINLLGIIKKNTFTLPSNIFSFFRKVEHAALAPLVIGIGTFFLPCGFTQAMQIAALSSGSFISGLLIMFAFALGTLPVLGLLSFSSVSFAHSKYAPVFFKSAGVVVVFLALFNLLNSLAVIGWIPPLFNF